MNHFKKINLILKTSFVIPVMTVFSALWSLMLIKLVLKLSFLELLTLKNLLAVFLTLNLLWVLRLIDEIKDFEYDKTAHPERALPSGLVAPKDVSLYILIFSMLGLLGSLFFHPLLLLLYLLTIMYGLFLIKLENASKLLKENFLINLLVTYPVNTLINLCLLSFYCPSFDQILLNAGFITIPFFAFLHYEFARKIRKFSAETLGLELYSEQIGFMYSLFISVMVALSAVTSHLFLTSFSAYHVLFLIWPVLFAALFILDWVKPRLYKASAMIFILAFYFFVTVV